MALNRITGLGMILLGSCMLYAGCDSGGSTATPAGGGNASGDTGGTSGDTGGASGTTGGAISGTTGGTSSATTTQAATGGATTTTQPAGCTDVTPPTASGNLSVSAGYVTVGTLKGYGFTWVGDDSNDTTCVTPSCNTTGCTPAFGATAICGAGVVTSDTDYASVVGIGMNLNQDSAGGDPASVAAGSTITVEVTKGSGTGDEASRVQLVDDAGTSYCVDAGSWSSGAPINITDFNTKCWNTSEDGATPLASGANVVSVHILIPSDATAERPYSICLTNVSM